MAFNLRLGASPVAKSSHEESEELAGGDLSLVLRLPDGSESTEVVRPKQFKVGVNVDWVANCAAQKARVPMERIVRSTQSLVHEGVRLLGPMSLCDYPQLTSGSVLSVVVLEVMPIS